MTKDNETLRLKRRIRVLEGQNTDLKKRIHELEERLGRGRGLPGEKYVAELTGGKLARYKDPYDVVTENGTRLEVKLSHPNSPGRSNTRRWNWHSPLGLGDTKQFDFLVLLGEKDPRYENQYPVCLRYVCFLVPLSDVKNIKSSWTPSVALNTNLETARAPKAEVLKRYLVCSTEQFKDLSPRAATAP